MQLGWELTAAVACTGPAWVSKGHQGLERALSKLASSACPYEHGSRPTATSSCNPAFGQSRIRCRKASNRSIGTNFSRQTHGCHLHRVWQACLASVDWIPCCARSCSILPTSIRGIALSRSQKPLLQLRSQRVVALLGWLDGFNPCVQVLGCQQLLLSLAVLPG